MDSRILLTGGTGMVGQATLSRLLSDFPDVNVRVPYRSRIGSFADDHRVEYVQADLRDRDQCFAVAEGCATAIMAAAVTGGAGAAMSEPWRQVTDNSMIDILLLDALYKQGVGKLVYVGTATVYQDGDGPFAEDDLDMNIDPPAAQFGVGWSKRYTEKLLRFWSDWAGLRIHILRLTNVFGPFARFDPAVSNVIPALIRRATEGDVPFEVWGSPDVVRNVIYADDVADAVIRAFQDDKTRFDILNIGHTRSVSVGEIARMILVAAGRENEAPVFADNRPTTARSRGVL